MLFRRKAPDPEEMVSKTLYYAIVAEARREDWYVAGGVPDSVDGRFDMLAFVLSLAVVRLEEIGSDRCGRMIVRLTERFVDDVDASLRQIGIGDMMIGKHVGRGMSALGGRLGAYRAALSIADKDERRTSLKAAMARNLYRGEGQEVAVDWAVDAGLALAAHIAALDEATLTGGRLST